MKILFVSRAFPPVLGGIEKQNFDLSRWLPKFATVRTLANRRGKKFLPIFLPIVFLRILFLLSRYDALLLGDGVLAPLGYAIKCFFPRKKVVSVVHGLDLTYSRKSGLLSDIYRHINLPSLKGLDFLICVSKETKRVAGELGIPPEQCFVLPNGIDPTELRSSHTRDDLSQMLGRDTSKIRVIIRIGRFVKHKGVEWFIRNVVPTLPEDVLFVAAGGVPTHAAPGDANIYPLCEEAVEELGLREKVVLLKNVPWETVRILLNTSDLAVAPNIRVAGAMEGFGISAIEASVCGLPVIASRLEGLQEAIQEGKNGILVEAGNAKAYREAIQSLLSNDDARRNFGREAASYTEEHYHWEKIAADYVRLFEKPSV